MINEAIRVLQSHHYRITKQRRSLLEYLCGFKEQYVSITQVTEHMKQLYPGMSYNTVYRNLKDFSELGIIREPVLNTSAILIGYIITTSSVKIVVACVRSRCAL